MKREITQVAVAEAHKLRNSQNYKNFNKDLHKSKLFLKENNLAAISSDKTNRLVITDEEDYKNRLHAIVEDKETYKV